MKDFLIDNVARAWRLLSVQVAAFAVVWGMVPVDQQKAILALVGLGPHHMPALFGIVFIVTRLIRQPQALQPPKGE